MYCLKIVATWKSQNTHIFKSLAARVSVIHFALYSDCFPLQNKDAIEVNMSTTTLGHNFKSTRTLKLGN